MSRQRQWQAKMRQQGRCPNCGTSELAVRMVGGQLVRCKECRRCLDRKRVKKDGCEL
jgi:ribosomal protein L37AE/L43A